VLDLAGFKHSERKQSKCFGRFAPGIRHGRIGSNMGNGILLLAMELRDVIILTAVLRDAQDAASGTFCNKYIQA
jgi:hypothetical protein